MDLLEFQPGAAGDAALRVELEKMDSLVLGNDGETSATPRLKEDREVSLLDCARASGVSVIGIRQGQPAIDLGADAKDRFLMSRDGTLLASLAWHQLGEWVRQNWSGKRLLLDLTSLSGSSLFQLYAATEKVGCAVSYLYSSPQSYPQVAHPDDYPPLITRSIKQPHGYRSFAQEHTQGSRRHIIVLGFDRHRPNKFIEHYQWPTEEVHAIIGQPAYVEGGEKQAELSLGPVFAELQRIRHVHTVDPKLPARIAGVEGVSELIASIAAGAAVVDLVPLGPKPTLLGCLLYWHGLEESARERVRFLYDFPVTRAIRTLGVGPRWLYRDVLPRPTES